MRHICFLMMVGAASIVTACGGDPTTDPSRIAAPDFSNATVPSAVSASAVSPAEIDLVWQLSSNQVNGFQVFRSTTGASGSYSLVATTAPSATTYKDLGLTASTIYCYEIRSFRTTGRNTNYSAYSEAACATTPAPAIRAPTGVDAVPMLSTRVDVFWKDSSTNETGFRVEISTDSGASWRSLAVRPPNSVTVVDTARQSEQRVCYRVIALVDAGESQP